MIADVLARHLLRRGIIIGSIKGCRMIGQIPTVVKSYRVAVGYHSRLDVTSQKTSYVFKVILCIPAFEWIIWIPEKAVATSLAVTI